MTRHAAFVLPQLGNFARAQRPTTSLSSTYALTFGRRTRSRRSVGSESRRSPPAASTSCSDSRPRCGTTSHRLPTDLADFHPIEGADGHGAAPAAQHDAWLWIGGSAADITRDHARAAAAAVAEVASLAAEQPAFTYHDGRDLTGFVDGTANPPTRLAPHVAMVPPERPGQGGCHVLVMRWVHDLDHFWRLAVGEQETVIGRTKPDSTELVPPARPPTAHISRVQVDDEHGQEVEVFRRSVPYGTVEECGLYFVAFSAQRARYDILLARMFGTTGDGLTDRLREFSRPVAGACYFALSLIALAEVGGPD
jgi:porphyrinogen peroxidase